MHFCPTTAPCIGDPMGQPAATTPLAVRDNRGAIRTPGALMTDVSGDRRAGTGSDWFPTVYERGIFVDKSMLIKDVLMGSQVVLFCRPRRFGKTLVTTMLKDFFECAPAPTRPRPIVSRPSLSGMPTEVVGAATGGATPWSCSRSKRPPLEAGTTSADGLPPSWPQRSNAIRTFSTQVP